MRIDHVLSKLFPDHSRSRLQMWLRAKQILVNGQSLRAKDKVQGGEEVEVNAELELQSGWQAQAADLNILFEDDDILVINKPVGLVVHPAAGNPDNTLINALLHHFPDLNRLPRCGMIHRLDKGTSGLLIFAKTLEAHTHLVDAMQKKRNQTLL